MSSSTASLLKSFRQSRLNHELSTTPHWAPKIVQPYRHCQPGMPEPAGGFDLASFGSAATLQDAHLKC